jgi:hypothetical protein
MKDIEECSLAVSKCDNSVCLIEDHALKDTTWQTKEVHIDGALEINFYEDIFTLISQKPLIKELEIKVIHSKKFFEAFAKALPRLCNITSIIITLPSLSVMLSFCELISQLRNLPALQDLHILNDLDVLQEEKFQDFRNVSIYDNLSESQKDDFLNLVRSSLSHRHDSNIDISVKKKLEALIQNLSISADFSAVQKKNFSTLALLLLSNDTPTLQEKNLKKEKILFEDLANKKLPYLRKLRLTNFSCNNENIAPLTKALSQIDISNFEIDNSSNYHCIGLIKELPKARLMTLKVTLTSLAELQELTWVLPFTHIHSLIISSSIIKNPAKDTEKKLPSTVLITQMQGNSPLLSNFFLNNKALLSPASPLISNRFQRFIKVIKTIINNIPIAPVYSEYKGKIPNLTIMIIPTFFKRLSILLNHEYDSTLTEQDLELIRQNRDILLKLSPPQSLDQFMKFLGYKHSSDSFKPDILKLSGSKDGWESIVSHCTDIIVSTSLLPFVTKRPNIGNSIYK